MAKGKGWGKKKDPVAEPEKPDRDITGQVPPDLNTGTGEQKAETTGILMEQTQQNTIPSCMNGCPHYFPTPEAGGKYMGLCRRYPPLPAGNARFFAWPVVINHPVRDFPKYPICGEHPIFRQERGRGMTLDINRDLAAG